jgi:hypothetical protein
VSRIPSHSDNQRGAVVIEFVMVLPILLFVLFAIVDFGRFFNYLNDTNQIAAAGARMAAVNTYPGAATLRAQGSTAELRDGSDAVPGGIQICVDFPNGSSNVGDPVRVRTTGNFKLVPILGGATVPLHGEATMRIERPPTYSAGC